MSEKWIRSLRGWQEKRGPWHLKAASAPSWSHRAECDVYPTQRKQTLYERPTEGSFCAKCLKAANARLAITAEPNDDDAARAAGGTGA